MSGHAKRRRNAISDSAERTAERMAHLRSGAAGVHADQRARRDGNIRTNREGSRAARRRSAVADQLSG